MKKHITLTFLAVLGAIASFAQGINFETGNWKAVVAKAKKEKKLIYVDVYTTWCGPCKMLAKEIFPKKEAGDKYNKLFVNYRLDAEKGEGITIATKYAVSGYPTHLFIDPANEAVIYRDMGATSEVKDFNHHADVAIQEKNDPMTWDKYTVQYNSGKKDKTFLTAYLKKSNLLKKENDAILNDYVATLNTNNITDDEIEFLAEMAQTADNKAMPIIYAHKAALDKKYPDSKNRYDQMIGMWIYGTFEKAVSNKDENVLKVLEDSRSKYQGKGNDAETYWYRTQYYTKIGDNDKALKAGIEEANFLTKKSVDDYAKEDAKAAEERKASLREQLKAMKAPDDKLDELVKTNIEKNPSILHSESMMAAQKLNGIAWTVYEKHSKDMPMVQQAMNWSKLSMDLSKDMPEWPLFADTYAHLMFVAGYEREAITLQEQAVEKAKADKSTEAASLEESLKQMKTGKL